MGLKTLVFGVKLGSIGFPRSLGFLRCKYESLP